MAVDATVSVLSNVVLMNSFAQARDLNHGYFRRIQFVPFRRTFLDEQADKSLLNRLLPELPGIFNFVLGGSATAGGKRLQLHQSAGGQEVHWSYMEEVLGAVSWCGKSERVEVRGKKVKGTRYVVGLCLTFDTTTSEESSTDMMLRFS